MNKKLLLTGCGIVFFDQIIKIIVEKCLILGDINEIIPSFFHLTRVHNTGAAWSILSGNRLLFIVIALISLTAIYMACIHEKKLNTFESIAFGLLMGGIIGNLIDRTLFGYVIDYLDFVIFNYDFPIFNLADSAIVIGVIGVLFSTLRGEKKNARI